MEEAVLRQVQERAAEAHQAMIIAIQAQLQLEVIRRDRNAPSEEVYDASLKYRNAEAEYEKARDREWALHKEIIQTHGIEAYG